MMKSNTAPRTKKKAGPGMLEAVRRSLEPGYRPEYVIESDRRNAQLDRMAFLEEYRRIILIWHDMLPPPPPPDEDQPVYRAAYAVARALYGDVDMIDNPYPVDTENHRLWALGADAGFWDS